MNYNYINLRNEVEIHEKLITYEKQVTIGSKQKFSEIYQLKSNLIRSLNKSRKEQF